MRTRTRILTAALLWSLLPFYGASRSGAAAAQTPQPQPPAPTPTQSQPPASTKPPPVAPPGARPAPTPYEPRAVADPSARPGWTRYQFGDSPAFSVLLPARPNASATSISSREDPNAVAHLFFADGASAVFGAQRMDGLTNDTERAAEAVRLSMFRNFVAGFADGFAEGLRKQGLDSKVEMGQPRKARIAGRDGFEQDFKYGPLDGRAQIVFAGHSMLCLMAVWSREDGVAADREAFFQSFRIDPPPAR